MLVGVPKEIKNNEYRAGLTSASVRELTMIVSTEFTPPMVEYT